MLHSEKAVVELEQERASLQAKHRAVVLRKGPGGETTVRAIGTLTKAVSLQPAKRSVGRRVPAKGLHPIGFAEGSAAHRKQPRRSNTFQVVDVLYATDREIIQPASSVEMPRFQNRLPEKPKIEYGICSVTIPRNHEPGKIESPSYWRFEFQANPDKHFTICDCYPVDSKGFFTQLNSRVSRSAERNCFVFIHGFNVSFEAAVLCTAQLAADLKFVGTPILYSWASANNARRYSQDEESNKMTWPPFRRFLTEVVRASGATRIHLIAHSMGNRALLDALERFAVDAPAPSFDQVVLAAPDVPRQNVEPLIASAKSTSSRLTLYASRKDLPLKLSSGKHKYRRLGRIYDDAPVVLQGLDTIDVSKFKGDFWGHSAFAKARAVVTDLKELLSGAPPGRRLGIQPVAVSDDEEYWILR